MQYNDNQGIQGGNYQLEKDNNASPPVANPNQQMYYAQPGQPQIVYQQPVYQQPIYQQPIYNQPVQPVLYPQAGYQPVMVQSGMPVQMAVPQFQFVDDPMALLLTAKSASVKQRFELFEVITGCETNNQYYVSTIDGEGNKKYLFKAKENSSCFCRNCCPGSSREFNLDLRRITYTSQGQEKKVDFAKFERPFKCTCCCLNRPEMTGKLVGPQSVPLGKVSEPCTVCDPIIKVHTKNNAVAYTITCDCCQCGFCCRNSLIGRCSVVKFDIFSGSSITEKPTGHIIKKGKGLESAIGDADFYNITFPPEASPEDKVLLIGAVIMIDYLYYEDKDDDSTHHRRHGRGYGGMHHMRGRPMHHHH